MDKGGTDTDVPGAGDRLTVWDRCQEANVAFTAARKSQINGKQKLHMHFTVAVTFQGARIARRDAQFNV